MTSPPDPRQAIVAHYDERAASYDESAMHRGLTEAVADLVDLTGVETTLDVATGTGLMLRSLLRRHDGLRLVGVDLSPGMLAVARRELPDAALVLGDAGAVPLPDGSVDLVTCITALHLFPDPGAVFEECRRVLRPGGRVVTATFRPATKHICGPQSSDFPRRHEAFASPELVAGELAPYDLELSRHADWTDGEDDLLICELRQLVREPRAPR